MLYKQSAIAVMVAVMLGAASLFGGLSIMPAFATHDQDAMELATKQVTQEDDESVIIDAINLKAMKLTSTVRGTLTVEIIQDGDVLRRANLGTAALKTSYQTVAVDVSNINVTGSFEILVEYEGSGVVRVSSVGVIEGTTTAGDGGSGDDDSGNENPTPPQEQEEELENVLTSKTIAQDDDQTTTVEAVKFKAMKLTSSVRGTLSVALVQDDKILDKKTFSTYDLKTSYQNFEAAFDEEITGEFSIVFMYEGSGVVRLSSIGVQGPTEPAENPDPEPQPNPEGKVKLTVNAVDQSGNEIIGMWIEVYKGMSASGDPVATGDTPETFELDAGPYIVAVADFEDAIFQSWQGSTQDRTRQETLASDKTFTAVYSTDGTQPPPDEPTPPPQSGPGSLTVFAHRIPSEYWGASTFTSANAAMWFVLYNSTGWIVHSGFFDENGSMVSGLTDGATYYVYATDCDECHGSTHDVVFDHWQDSITENPRAVTTGTDSHAYYAYDPDP